MKTSSDPRHLKRIRLLKALYSQQFEKTRSPKLSTQDKSELKEVLGQISKINSIIDSYAAKFSIEKMAKIDLSILQLGIYELIKTPRTPYKVVADEYIELAKEFGADRSPQLVNGILGKLIEKIKNDNPTN